MTFKPLYDYQRLLKAQGRGKPDWMDFKARGAASKKAYAIAAANEGRFAFAFRQAIREIIPEHPNDEFRAAYARQSVDAALKALDIGYESSAMQKFKEMLERATLDVVKRSGAVAAESLNKQLKVNFGFTVSDGDNSEEVKKATEEYGVAEIEPRWLTPVVPVNPYAKKWTKKHVLELVDQGITPQQHQVVRQVLQSGFDRGLRIERMYKDIRSNIGLTNREAQAVVNRRLLHEAAGMPEAKVESLVDKYAQQLLKKRAERIARTETITAQAEGRREMWQLAEESGNMPEVEREWVSAPASDNPDRPCEICLDLDGKTATITGHYDSIDGPIQSPPAHVQCRCFETLRRAKK